MITYKILKQGDRLLHLKLGLSRWYSLGYIKIINTSKKKNQLIRRFIWYNKKQHFETGVVYDGNTSVIIEEGQIPLETAIKLAKRSKEGGFLDLRNELYNLQVS
ncbi:MAG: hypothetical protein J6I84_04135 [Bacilli bacterium]|nr:hypothetical protein [Bacilli bacterium]